jgi:pSer/pThr/pTyr-binding forkhead associated (FHA) protein
MTTLRFGLECADQSEPFWLEGSITIGRHLDNDFIVAGEDVRDFHARIDLGIRGPRVTPIDGATVHVGEQAALATTGLMPDDDIVLGQHHLRVIAEGEAFAGQFALHEPGVARGVAIAPVLLVGRADDCGLRIFEGHISRRHARLSIGTGGVWLRDLDSANGTFVNGERLRGACLLFHGDEVAFDIARYQLIGDAPDLTPIRPVGGEPDQLAVAPLAVAPTADAPREVTATAQIEGTGVAESGPIADMVVRGPSLLGRSAPVTGRLFPLTFGRHRIGRSADADIVLAEPSVSAQHAEIEVKADGVFLFNLLSTNGTRVNGEPVNMRVLAPGDLVDVGPVRLEFLAPQPPERGLRRWAVGALVAAGVAAVIVLLLAGLPRS